MFESPKELIVSLKERVSPGVNTQNILDNTESAVGNILKKKRAIATPVFDNTGKPLANFKTTYRSTFLKVQVKEDSMEELASELLAHDSVNFAYIKPGCSLPVFLEDGDVEKFHTIEPETTPDFSSLQAYLNDAPDGINVRPSWGRVGGRGDHVKIVDIEGAWLYSHEDFSNQKGRMLSETQSESQIAIGHGTAVLGIIGSDNNSIGVTGISSNCSLSAISVAGDTTSIGTSQAIQKATNYLDRGDILLLEIQRPGPRYDAKTRRGFIPIEWWEDDFLAIQLAVEKGIIVIEAGGNGYQDLDDDIYQNPLDKFPSEWSNPFRRSNRDSGAIIVGAGAPANLDYGPARSRLEFSNFGSCFDVQGWGRSVVTSGWMGDLQKTKSPNRWYTKSFAGTSSAAAMIAGVVACLQGESKARSGDVLSPMDLRNAFRATGSAQQNADNQQSQQPIGSLPDIGELLQYFSTHDRSPANE